MSKIGTMIAANSRNWHRDFTAADKSYDQQNASGERHPRRFLVEAEPQIGKTGTYLYFLYTLQELIGSGAQQQQPQPEEEGACSISVSVFARWWPSEPISADLQSSRSRWTSGRTGTCRAATTSSSRSTLPARGL